MCFQLRLTQIFTAAAWLTGNYLAPAAEPSLPREQWGAPAVKVARANGQWSISGRKQTVLLNESNLAL